MDQIKYWAKIFNSTALVYKYIKPKQNTRLLKKKICFQLN